MAWTIATGLPTRRPRRVHDGLGAESAFTRSLLYLIVFTQSRNISIGNFTHEFIAEKTVNGNNTEAQIFTQKRIPLQLIECNFDEKSRRFVSHIFLHICVKMTFNGVFQCVCTKVAFSMDKKLIAF